MRIFLIMCSLGIAVLGASYLAAQSGNGKGKPDSGPVTKQNPGARIDLPDSRAILANLQHEVATGAFDKPLKFSEVLQLIRDHLQAAKRNVNFAVDDEAYRENMADIMILDAEIRLKSLPPKAPLQYLLKQALKQLPIKSAMVVRAGRVDVVPLSHTSKEIMLNQTFHVDFKDRKLSAALEELSELTGVSIITDPRTKEKANALVTARFHDDVAVQDAVRMLAEMAELKMVHLVTGIYVTTPEHATALQKELKLLYEGPIPAPAPGAGMVGMIGGGMMIGGPAMIPALDSPLAPPLPPARKRLDSGS